MPASPVEIRIRGRLDDRAFERFGEAYGGLAVAETVLRGEVADQAELHGILARLQELGCELLEVRRLVRRGTDRKA
jgi:hypothetical protein